MANVLKAAALVLTCTCVVTVYFWLCHKRMVLLPFPQALGVSNMTTASVRNLTKLEVIASRSIVSAKDIDLQQVVLVTGTDTSHFREARDSIASVQKHLPKRQIIFYDLGLKASEVKEVKRWCDIKYRKFDFSQYPPHIKNLKNYAWKILIIQEVLQKELGTLWFDSSIRFKCLDPMKQLENKLKSNGVTLVLRNQHSIYAATDTRMYNFLPKDLALYKKKHMYGGGFIGVINTKEMFEGFISKLVKCAMNRACISPPNARLHCSFKKNAFTEYDGCHRFDQSAMNILLLHHFKGNTTAYISSESCFSAERYPTSHFTLHTC